MAIKVVLHHRTHYRYARPITLSPQTIRLRPAPHCRTPILSYALKIEPAEHFINWQQDPQANFLARVVFPEKVSEFCVDVDLVAELAIINPFDFFLEEYAENFPFDYESQLKEELRPFLCAPVDTGIQFLELLGKVPRDPQKTIDFLVMLNRMVQQAVDYLVRLEPGIQTPEQTLQIGSGSCRDSAWLLINLLRSLGFAARFTSGYIIQLRPDQKSLDGPSGTEVDFTDLHAWAEVFLPGAGWVGLDPTSGLLAGEGHIPLACAPFPSSAAPITGLLEEAETEFEFKMTVERTQEAPRVTLPFSDEAWDRLDALGKQVDARMAAADLRMTMGGEPTFVGIDNIDLPEWNTAAVGNHKLERCGVLFKRLTNQFGVCALLHYGQGKWYPGESLPRWAFTAFWRKDGQPVWKDMKLFADLQTDYGFGIAEAERFSKELGKTLGVSVEFQTPAFEDPLYALWKEQGLPVNVDPLDNRLKDPEERKRLADTFSRGLDVAKGVVFPIQRWWQGKAPTGWITGPLKLRRKQVYLIPGDSPIGLRLPLESLPWVSAKDYPHVNPIDPTVAGDHPLPDRGVFEQAYFGAISGAEEEAQTVNRQKLSDPTREPRKGESAGWIVRTALCIEPRGGKLFVFMPPVKCAEDYFDLITAIEATAARLKMPIVIEGEKPPSDSRLAQFSITPDPGVLEVNVHPARSWDELTDITHTVYEEARLSRLTTEKFMIDGRHTGTGGGNHIVIGGEKPLDSPLLRRPELLSSLLIYWQRHPTLSYLFSGLFIGPTSQSPRIDEARQDILYELELALAEVARVEGNVQPWVVDRIFRNLLTDVTGNTHRAEFCIDKLYSPDRASGRLGLLELRSFEMPPHARMSLAQQLLIRALVLKFWEKPIRTKRLCRWGTQLHDRFMLPEWVWQDFLDVLDELREDGIPMETEWFKSHFEFRFPLYGNVEYRGINLEVRHALEPWHVLGEEGSAGGTVRFVDSSVERIQVKVTQWIPDRYALACNGELIPLQSTGAAGVFAAGIRYRAWQPPSCLHPTIPVDTPLTIDIVDRWTDRAVAGCTYHVAHPGGRNYEQVPINAYEAESRRLARFQTIGHTPGSSIKLHTPPPNPEYSHTLDLRRCR